MTREKETVTDLVMEVNMTAMLVVREILSAEAIIVKSSEDIIMRRMTAVRSRVRPNLGLRLHSIPTLH